MSRCDCQNWPHMEKCGAGSATLPLDQTEALRELQDVLNTAAADIRAGHRTVAER